MTVTESIKSAACCNRNTRVVSNIMFIELNLVRRQAVSINENNYCINNMREKKNFWQDFILHRKHLITTQDINFMSNCINIVNTKII